MSHNRPYIRNHSLRVANTNEESRLGWSGESAWNRAARKWFKRFIHKMNRRFVKRSIEQEVNDLRVNGAI